MRIPRKTKQIILTAAKAALLVFLVVFLVLLMTRESVKDVSMDKIGDKMGAIKSVSVLHKGTDKSLLRYYDLTGDDYDGYVMYKSGSPMSVDELLIIKTKEDSQRAAVESAMRRHVRSQMKSFEGYGTAQIALLKAKIMDTEGPYVFLAISDDAEKWKKAFDDIIN
ncbi:MAG: DUF4358 domain-containing protein [Firmicutes bacterium]|nr:DUF4358 domain-containing protein [Bacillota bacterium]MBR2511478.1 DUF4358 domain-containing protein [Bacillota bacterium]